MSHSLVRLCAVGDVPVGGIHRVEFDGESLALVRVGDEIFAVSDTCSHDDVSLSDGDVDGHVIECWLHGSRFDVRTGKALCLPARKSLPTYDLTIDGDDVYVQAPASSSLNQESNAR